MIEFRYRVDTTDYPVFVPVCATCHKPILDVHNANIEKKDNDFFLYHSSTDCSPDGTPWCRWAEVMYWLLPPDWRKLVWKAYKDQRCVRYQVFG
jgi:hypothetical protein